MKKRADVLWRVYVGLNTEEGETVDGRLYERCADRYFSEGYTLFRATGAWKGEREETYIFEIFIPWGEGRQVVSFAEELKRLGNQDSVLVTNVSVKDNFLV